MTLVTVLTRSPPSLRSSLAGARCDPHAGGLLVTVLTRRITTR